MTALEPWMFSHQARELRRAFDATFALPPSPPSPPTVALLLVRAGGETVALKRTDMIGFVRGESIALTPGGSPAFFGLAGLRGGVFPVWSLAGLLGRSLAPVGAACWLALAQARANAPCAFACEAFERMIFLSETAFATVDAAGRIVIPWGAAQVPVVDLSALQTGIWERKEATQPRRSNS